MTQPLPATVGKFDAVLFCFPSLTDDAFCRCLKAALGKLELNGAALIILTLDQHEGCRETLKKELRLIGLDTFVSEETDWVYFEAKRTE